MKISMKKMSFVKLNLNTKIGLNIPLPRQSFPVTVDKNHQHLTAPLLTDLSSPVSAFEAASESWKYFGTDTMGLLCMMLNVC